MSFDFRNDKGDPDKSITKVACSSCRSAKLKCDGDVGSVCSNCRRKKLDCVRHQHRKRGRRQDSFSTKANHLSSIFPLEMIQTINSFLAISPFYPFFSFSLEGKRTLG
jgi:hypothetical protein